MRATVKWRSRRGLPGNLSQVLMMPVSDALLDCVIEPV
jgi:hypothetical protein